jgi:parallel beta-helix repeat protein
MEKSIKIHGTILLVLFTGLLGFITFEIEIVEATTLYAGGSGPGNYSSIQDAIDAANPGDTVYVFIGNYYENVVVNKRINLTGENKETTVINGGHNDNVVVVTEDWVNISGLRIINSESYDFSAGIDLRDVQNCNISNNIVTSNGQGISLDYSDTNTITNNIISSNLYDGIHFDESHGNNITYNTISKNNYGLGITYSSMNNIIGNNISSIDIYNIHLLASTFITISNNIMMDGGIYIFSFKLNDWNTHNIDSSNTVNGKPVYYWKNQSGGTVPAGTGQVILANCTNIRVEDQNLTNTSIGIQLGFSSNNIIVGNDVSNNCYGIYLYSSNGNYIANNNASNIHANGLYFRSSDGNNITNNMVSSNDNKGISLRDSNENDITDNTVSSNKGIGINLEFDCDGNNIINNIVRYNEDAIYLEKADGNNIISNNASSNRGSGIYLVTSSSNNIKNNTVSLNSYYGFYLYTSSKNLISGNDIINNEYGIQMTYSNENNITANIIMNSGQYGIYIYYSTPNNSIFHNDFIFNQNQTYDESNDNYWDIGYPSGGNYWSDYNGSDEFSGPNQNEPGGDGIGDTPYMIGMLSRDNYPLMDSVVIYPLLFENITIFPYIQDIGENVNISAQVINNQQAYGVLIEIYHPDGSSIGNFSMNYDDSLSIYYFNHSYSIIGLYNFTIWANDLYKTSASLSGSFSIVSFPGTPINTSVTADGSTNYLKWNKPQSDGGSPITNYRIYRGTAKGAETFLIEIGNVTYYNDSTISRGVIYYYKVSAVNEAGEGAVSEGVSISVPKKRITSMSTELSLGLGIIWLLAILLIVIGWAVNYVRK